VQSEEMHKKNRKPDEDGSSSNSSLWMPWSITSWLVSSLGFMYRKLEFRRLWNRIVQYWCLINQSVIVWFPGNESVWEIPSLAIEAWSRMHVIYHCRWLHFEASVDKIANIFQEWDADQHAPWFQTFIPKRDESTGTKTKVWSGRAEQPRSTSRHQI